MRELYNDLEYWTKKAMEIIKKQGKPKPIALEIIKGMEDFKTSGVSEEELSKSISATLDKEKQSIIDTIKRKLKK